MNQQNTTTNVGNTDPSSGAVYTSGTNQSTSGTGGAVYTSGVNPQGAGTSSTSSVGTSGGNVNVAQIRQQLQSIQSQLRQTQTSGSSNQAYTDAANRLQDVFEILNNSN